ncbi:hypothetical protein ACFP81_08560 [Deinococcus lacus]|uniref:Uncharacterized protein n=1 Tax=Deinococcus lacus TaxID=392561 RepID=A0ABW1YF31_9DEIO
MTQAATVRLLEHCADIRLSGTAAQPVKVEQNVGFSAPTAEIDSPQLTGEILQLKMSFDFEILDSLDSSNLGFNLDATEKCENGVRVPV